MLTDIEIAQQAKMKKIGEIAANLGIEEDEVEQYGHYKAKLNQKLFNRLADKPDGKLILVTAINPTPAGEGKTTTSVGLCEARTRSEERLYWLCASRPSARCSESRAEPQAAATLR